MLLNPYIVEYDELIVTTFHPLYRDEFIVLNNVTENVEHYKKYSFMKDFWCDREEPIEASSLIRFRKIRDDYFEEKIWRL